MFPSPLGVQTDHLTEVTLCLLSQTLIQKCYLQSCLSLALLYMLIFHSSGTFCEGVRGHHQLFPLLAFTGLFIRLSIWIVLWWITPKSSGTVCLCEVWLLMPKPRMIKRRLEISGIGEGERREVGTSIPETLGGPMFFLPHPSPPPIAKCFKLRGQACLIVDSKHL